MLTKELFIEAINNYNRFTEAIDRISDAISGKGYRCDLFESDWYDAVYNLVNCFLKSYFQPNGIDLIYWWLFENADKIITIEDENGDNEDIDVTTIDSLWDYMVSFKHDYFIE